MPTSEFGTYRKITYMVATPLSFDDVVAERRAMSPHDLRGLRADELYPEMTGEPGLTVDDDATELDRRARRDAGIDPEKPLATMSRAEAAAYVAAARRELSEDPWLRARLGHA